MWHRVERRADVSAWTWIGLVLLAALLMNPGVSLRAAEPTVVLHVASAGVGSQPEIGKPFANALWESGDKTVAADSLRLVAEEANAAPVASTATTTHLWLRTSTFSAQGFVVAQQLDEQGCTIRSVVLGHHQYWNNSAMHWGDPTADLVYLVRQSLDAPPPVGMVPTLVEIRPWADDAGPGTAPGGGIDKSLNMQNTTRQVGEVTDTQLVTALTPLVRAVAFENGLAPMNAPPAAAPRLLVEVASGYKGYALRATLKGAAGSSTLAMEFVSEEHALLALRRLIRGVAINVALAPATTLPTGTRVLGIVHPVAALGAPKAGELVPLPLSPVTATEISDRALTVHWGADVRTFELKTGQIDSAAPAAKGLARGKSRKRRAATAADGWKFEGVNLSRLDGGKAMWQVALPATIISGAEEFDDMVAVVTRNGHLSALALSDGSVRWSLDILAPLATLSNAAAASPSVSSARVFALDTLDGKAGKSADASGDSLWLAVETVDPSSLVLIESATHTVRWCLPLDDRLAAPPVVVGDSVLVVTKSSRLLNVPLAVSKTAPVPSVETIWPTWMTHVEFAADPDSADASGIIVVDLLNRVSYVSPTTLKPLAQLTIGQPVTAIATGTLPVPWPTPGSALHGAASGDGAASLSTDPLAMDEVMQADLKRGEPRTVLLVGDADGFLWMLAPFTVPAAAR